MATTVTDILQQILLAQANRTMDGQTAMVKILEATRRQVAVELTTLPADSFSSHHQQQVLAEIDRLLAGAGTEMRAEITKGLDGSWDDGADLLPQMARAGSNITLTTFGLSTNVLDQVKAFTWGKVSGITADAQARIRGELTMGLLGQKTPYEITQAIAGTLESPGVFKGIMERAEVITKTELGRTFSMAHQAGMENALDVLPELQKMWLHAGHPRSPRIYHLHLNGAVMAVDKPFLVGNIAMMYPRDPQAPVSEIVNCGCMHVAYMPEWGSKQEFLRSWGAAQRKANQPKTKKVGPV